MGIYERKEEMLVGTNSDITHTLVAADYLR
jgi:hypothetical protein